MNMNDLAKWITEEEGGSQQVNIAQVHEVLAAIKKIYRRYLELSPTPQDVPFRINKLCRLLTGDLEVKCNIDAHEEWFTLRWQSDPQDYLKKEEELNKVIAVESHLGVIK